MAFGIPGYFGRDPDRIPDPLIPGSRTKTIRVKYSGLFVIRDRIERCPGIFVENIYNDIRDVLNKFPGETLLVLDTIGILPDHLIPGNPVSRISKPKIPDKSLIKQFSFIITGIGSKVPSLSRHGPKFLSVGFAFCPLRISRDLLISRDNGSGRCGHN
jgi:hypothetical protein